MNVRREQPLTNQIWWLFMLRGVLAAVLGISALIWPVMAAVLIFLGVRFRQLQARVEGIPPTGPVS